MLDCDPVNADGVQVVQELAEKALGLLELVAQRPAHRQVLGHGLAQRAHRTAPGHGRAICLSASRLTLA
jgi:hypothetical protein